MQYNSTEQLKSFSTLPIDWNLDPADAVKELERRDILFGY